MRCARRKNAIARAAIAFALALAGGCAHRAGPEAIPHPATEASRPEANAERQHRIEQAGLALLPVDAWRGRRLLRQRVRIDWPGGSESFDAVLQRRPGELTLFGLGPMNLVGFRLALLDDDGAGGAAQRIEIDNRSGRALPFSAAHVLADVQRVFYPWIDDEDEPDPGCDACERTGRQGAVEVWERGPRARPSERRFALVDPSDASEIRIRYADWQGDPAFPGRVELENGWFGYGLRIETLESSPLPTP